MTGSCGRLGVLWISCAVVAVGALTGVPGEAAALTLGPTAPGAFDLTSGEAQTWFIKVAPQGVQLTAPADGVITRFRTAANQTVTLRVLRKIDPNYIGVSTGPQVPALGTGIVVTTETHMPIAAGDTIGMDVPMGTVGGGSASGWTLGIAQPPLPDGGPPQLGLTVPDTLAFVNADFELDADSDGFGDESQDRCPGSAGPDHGCPPPSAGPTGERDAAIKKCKKKHPKGTKKRKKCIKKAKKLPV